MYQLLTDPASLPFSLALFVVAGLFLIELLGAIFGTTILAAGSDAPDIDLDADFDLTGDGGGDIDPAAPETAETVSGGLFTWMGARDVPFLIWLVSFLTIFGLSGLVVQSVVAGLFGAALPVGLAVAAAVPPALAVTRVLANWVALIMPKTESTALSARQMAGHRGTITQGTARPGKPAEAKVRDRHGNIHYLRVEPLRDNDCFVQGSDVTVIRKRGDRFFVI